MGENTRLPDGQVISDADFSGNPEDLTGLKPTMLPGQDALQASHSGYRSIFRKFPPPLSRLRLFAPRPEKFQFRAAYFRANF